MIVYKYVQISSTCTYFEKRLQDPTIPLMVIPFNTFFTGCLSRQILLRFFQVLPLHPDFLVRLEDVLGQDLRIWQITFKKHRIIGFIVQIQLSHFIYTEELLEMYILHIRKLETVQNKKQYKH